MRVAATLPWYPSVIPNDRIELGGSIRPPPEDDYGVYLARIGAIGTIRADQVQVLPAAGGLAGWLEGLRRVAASGLDRAMPEPEAGLAAGVLIGLRDRVDRDLAAAFTTAGASHVVAISGWNIAIVASTLGARRAASAPAPGDPDRASRSLAYVAFVGRRPRSCAPRAMAGVALLARETRPARDRGGGARLGRRRACSCSTRGCVDDPGFRLSVLATAGILAWGYAADGAARGLAAGRVATWLAEILGVSLAAQAATLPVVLLTSGGSSLVSPAVNLLVVPLVAARDGAPRPVALLGGAVGRAGVPGDRGDDRGAAGVGAATRRCARSIRAVPRCRSRASRSAPPWTWSAAASSFAAIAAGARWGDRLLGEREPPASPRRRLSASSARSPCGARRGQAARARRRGSAPPVTGDARGARRGSPARRSGSALVVAHRPDGAARITVLDVGQGDAILVEGGRGGRHGRRRRPGSGPAARRARSSGCRRGTAGSTSSS